MRIKNLHLENFRGFEKLDLEFPENSNVVVLIGENGSGKTTVLDAISKLIEAIIAESYFVSNKDFALHFDELDVKKQAKSWCVKGIIDTYALRGRISFEFRSLKNRLSFVNPNDIPNVFSFLLLAVYRYKKNDNLSFYDEIKSLVLPRRNRLRDKIEVLTDIYADALGIRLLETKEIFKLWFLDRENLELQSIFDKEDFSFRLVELEVFRHIIKTFYNNLDDVKFDNLKGNRQKSVKIFEKTNAWIELTKDNETLQLDQLSSGELTLLLLVTDMTRRLLLMTEEPNIEKIQQSEGIVLIDEIDLHLHPKWQRNILPALTKTFPNVQFIVTTHSPQVLSNVPKESVFLLENNQLSDKQVFTEGRDSNSILQDAFSVSEMPEKYQDELRAIYQLIDAGNAAEAQGKLAKLIEKRGENDREVVRMQSYIDFL